MTDTLIKTWFKTLWWIVVGKKLAQIKAK